MRKLKVLSLLLCIGIVCNPLHASAKEGFSWEILSDEDTEQDTNDEEDQKEDSGSDTDEEKEDEDEDRKDAGDEQEDEDEDREDEDEYEDAGDGDVSDESASSKGKYPSGAIYSKAEAKKMIAEKYKELKEAYEIEDAFKKTKTIDSIDSFILNFCGDPLADMKIAFLGDSITAGNGGTLTPDGSGLDYTDFIAKYTSAEIVNLGIGGTPIEGNDNDDAIVNRYEDIPDDTDIIVLFAGINDLFAGAEYFGSLEDPEEGTYCGDTKETFEQIAALYEDAEVYVVITYPNKMEEYKEYTGENWQEYADIQIELADEYDFHVINLYKEGFLDSNDTKVRNSFFKDDIHPDDLGSEVLGRHILVHLIRDYI